MDISFFSCSVNEKKSVSNIEPFCAVLENQINFNKCINCPGLCLKCIKKLYDISAENIRATSYRVVYVLSGKIKLFFPYINTEKRLNDNEVMLILNDTKLVIESGNELPANFVVRDLDELAKEKRVKCSYS
ncbi:hypothetical protein [Sporomusa malonica]|uniref:Uncharacterized protein n=1 Tax=Sporomusa malonica TaxID=112901 RepID=A0A1W2C693_9FIRM|nr:hypothetical protein [Sporomusa malonica]SMC80626.1 hypothetical protein SAMN04488500_109172 [Sporomusa malonica]